MALRADPGKKTDCPRGLQGSGCKFQAVETGGAVVTGATLMSFIVLLICIVLMILVSVLQQWKLLVLLAVLLAANAGVLLWYSTQEKTGVGRNAPIRKQIESIRILYGNEKKALLKDPEFQEILRTKYNMVINGDRTDGIRIPKGKIQDIDGLWLSTATAAADFQKQHPNASCKTDTVFVTPLVLCSWRDIAEVLVSKGLAEKRETLYIVRDMKKLLHEGSRTWESLRAPGGSGSVVIQSADPDKSISGFLMLGLTSLALNSNRPIDSSAAQKLAPEIRNLRKQAGPHENSADTLFNRYIKQGQEAFPLIAVCENQIIEFYQAYPSYQEKIRNQVRVLMPEPTVLSEHVFLALTKKGEMLLTALCDPDIRKLAWEKFGFRSAVPDAKNDPGELKAVGLPLRLKSPVPLPEITETFLEN
jgi:hypothetical protein